MTTETFAFTDEEFLKVLNNICKKEIPTGEDYSPISSMEENVTANRLDSLGMILFFVWISELFGIPEKDVDAFVLREVFTAQKLKDFIMENSTQVRSYQAYLDFVEETIRI